MVPCNFTAVAKPTKVVLFIPSGSSVLVVRGRLATTLLPPVVAVVNCDTCSTSASVRPSTSAHLSNVIIRSICYIHTPDIKMLTDWTCCGFTYTHTHTRSTALCPGLPERASTRKVNQSGFYWSKRQWVAVISPGLIYASLAHRSRQKTMPATHHSVFYGAGCPSCRPTNSVKALKANAFTFHSTQKVNSETFPKPISWLDMDKTKPNKTKACIHQSKEMYYNKK